MYYYNIHIPTTGFKFAEGRVLVWDADYATSVYLIKEKIHDTAVWVWFQMLDKDDRYVIQKYQREGFDWIKAEESFGKVPYISYNPFKEDNYAAM